MCLSHSQPLDHINTPDLVGGGLEMWRDGRRGQVCARVRGGGCSRLAYANAATFASMADIPPAHPCLSNFEVFFHVFMHKHTYSIQVVLWCPSLPSVFL